MLRAKIKTIDYRFPVGLATLHFEDGTRAYLSSGWGLCALMRLFDDPIGKEIEYITDDMGLGTIEGLRRAE